MRTLLDDELLALEMSADAATPGPWMVESRPGAHMVYTPSLPGFSASCGEREDAVFIAAARECVPLLVAEVRRLRARLGDRHFRHSDPPPSFDEDGS